MLNQQVFEQQYEKDWQRLDSALQKLESRRLWHKRASDNIDLPTLYAALCQQHSLALSRGYSHALTNRLHDLIVRAHHQLYKHRAHVLEKMMQFFGGGFASALRAQYKLLTVASLLFFVPTLVCGVLAAYSVDFADLFMGARQRFMLEQMYDPANDSIRPAGLESQTNLYMFGYYIANNIGIDFRVFASGIMYCVGSVFFLVFNGIHIGAAAGHLTALGYNETFWGFVAGHSAPELIALCISGTAGLMLGMALIKPGRQTRRLALTRAAKNAVPIIIGAGLMTLFAAFIEAYWSANNMPFKIKIIVGVALWVLTIAYLALSGRGKKHHG